MIVIDDLILKVEETKVFTIQEAELIIDALILYKEMN